MTVRGVGWRTSICVATLTVGVAGCGGDSKALFSSTVSDGGTVDGSVPPPGSGGRLGSGGASTASGGQGGTGGPITQTGGAAGIAGGSPGAGGGSGGTGGRDSPDASLDGESPVPDGSTGPSPDAAPPPCTLPDDDGDGVCNALDRCPGFDDRVDADNDGEPDACEPHLLKDTNTVTLPSDPSFFTDFKGAVYFTARDPYLSSLAWRTDGTKAGTSPILTSVPGAPVANTGIFKVGGGFLYYVDLAVYPNTWSATDGTPGNTVHVGDFSGPAIGTANAFYWVVVGSDGASTLYRTTAPSATPTKLLSARSIMSGTAPLDALGRVFFRADDGDEPWITDGTVAGTHELKDVNSSSSAAAEFFTKLGDRVYFIAFGGARRDLWVTDGTEAGTTLVPTGTPDTWNPSSVVGTRSHLLFMSYESELDGAPVDLWSSDGTAAGSYFLQTLPADAAALFAAGDAAYFSFQHVTQDGNYELWSTDGTAAGTSAVASLGQAIQFPTPVGDVLYFVSSSFLYRYDPTGGLVQLTTKATIQPQNLSAAGGRLYFSGSTAAHGHELWSSDGTAAGTAEVADLNQGTDDAFPRFAAGPFADGEALFTAQTYADGQELWKTSGTTETTSFAFRVATGTRGVKTPWIETPNAFFFVGDSTPAAPTPLYSFDVASGNVTSIANTSLQIPSAGVIQGDQAIFPCLGDSTGNEPWAVSVSDLTANPPSIASAHPLADLNPAGDSSPGGFVELSGKTYFSASSDGSSNYSLYVTDGTAGGTVRVTPADLSVYFTGTIYGSSLYFSVYDPQNYRSALYRTDGTEASTKALTTSDALSPNLEGAVVWRGHLYFSGDAPSTGVELYRTDGTQVELAADLLPGTAGSFPEHLAVFNDTLYFSAEDATLGVELWRSDGTANGSHVVVDLDPGAASSAPTTLFTHRGLLYFVANDGVHGPELFHSDGTAAGTYLAKDIYPGQTGSELALLRNTPTVTYLSARDPLHGVEPWILP